ncbi:hypothetical protein Pint_25832 [Pistacia integerrima]|uniref:Uncharacterized protein n=1 Tax=Pistacia integerrima TaxID=434235 RepID=A0ACC0YA75_9ROSI|nr:hypothetical protein Pint_25832 [Pistacia integerrima]
MVMNKDVENSSRSKRKRKSKVWEDFTHSVGKDGKEWAQCNHCERMFGGSSKSGTTHLKNHLNSCSFLRNPGGVANKAKEKTVIDPEINGSDLVRKIIKYGLEGIKDEIVDVYQQEKDKLRGYLDKLPCRLNVTIQDAPIHGWSMKIWFIDDSWELKNWIICFGRYTHDSVESVKFSLVDWKIDKKISAIAVRVSDEEEGLLSFTGICPSISSLFERILHDICSGSLVSHWEKAAISTKLDKLSDYVRTNENKFQSAIEKALSKGKTVTCTWGPLTDCFMGGNLRWALACKEALCELEDIDPDFKSINFIKEDWDEATLMYNCQKALNDLGEDVDNFLFYLRQKTANEYFPMICQIFSKLDQLERSDNSYICDSVSHLRKNIDKLWNGSMLVLVTRVILDPRFKKDFIEEKLYKEMYDNYAGAHLIRIIDDVTNIFNQYVKETNNPMSSFSQESELNCYFNDPKCPLDKGLDILQWWRDKSSTYPTVARMAREFLSIPIFVNHEDEDESENDFDFDFGGHYRDDYDFLKILNADVDFKFKFS